MKCCSLMLCVIVGCCLLMQAGCEQEKRVSGEPKTTPLEAKQTVVTGTQKVLTPPPPGPAQESERAKTTSPPAEESRAASGQPKITFEKVTHDFGNISPGSKNTCEFRFKNTGTGLLRIGKIQSTCGCTVPELNKREYAPGESGAIKATYRASTAAGSVTKRLHVPSNDKKNSKVALTLKGTIVVQVTHEPKRMRLVVKDANTACPQIELKSADGRAFAIRRFTSTGGGITAAFDSAKNATEFVLEPELDIEKLKTRSSGQIRISLTHPGCPYVTIPFNIVPEFQINPNAITLRNLEPQKKVKRDVWVINNYGEDFEIESMSSEKDAIRVLSREKADKRYKLVLEITPPDQNGKTSFFRDVFSVTIKGGPKLKLSCRGFYSTQTGKR